MRVFLCGLSGAACLVGNFKAHACDREARVEPAALIKEGCMYVMNGVERAKAHVGPDGGVGERGAVGKGRSKGCVIAL